MNAMLQTNVTIIIKRKILDYYFGNIKAKFQ